VSRDDLTPSDRAQLDALDRILAREPVGEEHLELAALVESVRGDAPRMAPEFAHRLDGVVAQRLQRRRRRLRPPAPRRVAFAGAGLIAAAVALSIVLTSGVLGGASGTGRPTPLNALARGKHPASPTHRAAAPGFGTSAAPSVPAASGTTGAPRLVHRSSELELATAAASLSRVAGRIVALTEGHGGVVASSHVSARGAASGASFSLRVPSGRLAGLIAALSSLGSVRSLSQSTADVTAGYRHIRGALAARRAERATLVRRLASAASTAQATSLRARIAALDALIARDVRRGAAVLASARTAGLHVDVVIAARRHHAVAAPGGGPLDRASRTALHALEDLLALALVALAIALPVAACGLVLWWGAASVRQRARERAIRAV